MDDGPAPQSSTQEEGLSAHVLGRINRNSAFLIVGQLGARTISFVYILVLARYLGVEDFGQYNLVMNLVLIAITAVDFGLTRLIVRNLSGNRSAYRSIWRRCFHCGHPSPLRDISGFWWLPGWRVIRAVR